MCLANKLSINGRLLTFCRAAAIRASLRRSGLELKSLLSTDPQSNNWSNGTVAIKRKSDPSHNIKTLFWRSLSKQEEEHLKTNAAVPYRDPNSKSPSIIILKNRLEEQRQSKLLSTSLWKKRWNST